MLPNLIIPGASRSGTTFLFGLLGQHPDIFVPDRKELQFFEKEGEFKKGMSYYEEYFSKATNEKIRLEISPPYFHKGLLLGENFEHLYWPEDDAATRIRNAIPNVKILITLRNPVHRLYSQYHKNFFQGKEKLPLKKALSLEKAGERTKVDTPYCWIYKNHYSIHLEHWFSLFPAENVKVIIFEEWINSDVLQKQVLKFLGLKDFEFDFGVKNRNTGKKYENSWRNRKFFNFLSRKKYRKINAKEYKMIQSYIGSDLQRVEEILGRDLSVWKKSNL